MTVLLLSLFTLLLELLLNCSFGLLWGFFLGTGRRYYSLIHMRFIFRLLGLCRFSLHTLENLCRIQVHIDLWGSVSYFLMGRRRRWRGRRLCGVRRLNFFLFRRRWDHRLLIFFSILNDLNRRNHLLLPLTLFFLLLPPNI